MTLSPTNKKGLNLAFLIQVNCSSERGRCDIKRHFPRSLGNLFHVFSHRVDDCICFMNDGESPILVFEQKGGSRDILHEGYYQQLLASITK